MSEYRIFVYNTEEAECEGNTDDEATTRDNPKDQELIKDKSSNAIST